MQNGDEASTSISPAGRGHDFWTALYILISQILLTDTFWHCLATGMQNGDEASVMLYFFLWKCIKLVTKY